MFLFSLFQAICKVYLADLTSSKPNVQFSPSTLRVPLNNAVSGHYRIRVQGISKEHQRECVKVFAKLPENDDSESNSRKTYEDVLDAVTDKSESDLRSEKSSLGSTESSSCVEDVSNCLSFPRQELSQYLFDPEVYLHKLRAVNLHVLASEQWNASSLKTCHRYDFVLLLMFPSPFCAVYFSPFMHSGLHHNTGIFMAEPTWRVQQT